MPAVVVILEKLQHAVLLNHAPDSRVMLGLAKVVPGFFLLCSGYLVGGLGCGVGQGVHGCQERVVNRQLDSCCGRYERWRWLGPNM